MQIGCKQALLFYIQKRGGSARSMTCNPAVTLPLLNAGTPASAPSSLPVEPHYENSRPALMPLVRGAWASLPVLLLPVLLACYRYPIN